MRVLVIDNRPDYLLSHRLHLVNEARNAGYEVHVAALTPGDAAPFRELGISYHEIAYHGGSGGVRNNLRILMSMCRLYNNLNPRICHLVTMRSILLGLVAKIVSREKNASVVCSVTGLGFLFIEKKTTIRVLSYLIGKTISLFARRCRHLFIFQNSDDLELFARRGWVQPQSSLLVRGSGVDTGRFVPSPLPGGLPVVLFPARYLRHKGLLDFVRAAEILTKNGTTARFALAGGVDPDNPASVGQDEVSEWVARGIVEDWGFSHNMPQTLGAASLVVLPSYREGMPKVLLEAAACGRAIVTVDTPGCRQAVKDGVTGRIVPARDPILLARAIDEMLSDQLGLIRMGEAGRKRVEAEFSTRVVCAATLEAYEAVLSDRPS